MTIEMRHNFRHRAYAACTDHLPLALTHMDGRVVKVRCVTGVTDPEYRCSCEQPANWFLFEVEPTEDPAQAGSVVAKGNHRGPGITRR